MGRSGKARLVKSGIIGTDPTTDHRIKIKPAQRTLRRTLSRSTTLRLSLPRTSAHECPSARSLTTARASAATLGLHNTRPLARAFRNPESLSGSEMDDCGRSDSGDCKLTKSATYTNLSGRVFGQATGYCSVGSVGSIPSRSSSAANSASLIWG
jgi:hypothetical protein